MRGFRVLSAAGLALLLLGTTDMAVAQSELGILEVLVEGASGPMAPRP